LTFVVFDEIIPESYRRGHVRSATSGFVAGLALMAMLELLFGG